MLYSKPVASLLLSSGSCYVQNSVCALQDWDLCFLQSSGCPIVTPIGSQGHIPWVYQSLCQILRLKARSGVQNLHNSLRT